MPHAWDVFKWADDKNTIKVIISFRLPMNAAISDFHIEKEWCHIQCSRFFDFLNCLIVKDISRSLYGDIQLFNANKVILWYIFRILPDINKKIREQRHDQFHFLIRESWIIDVREIAVMKFDDKKEIYPIKGIGVFDKFPFENKVNSLYHSDFMDSIYLFFSWYYDDAIRKIVTSIDIYMKVNKWEWKTLKNWRISTAFKSKLEKNLPQRSAFEKTILSSLKFVYDIRNFIVHEGKRINDNDFRFVHLAITLCFYFYKITAKSAKDHDFYLDLEIQYISLRDNIIGIDLNFFQTEFKQDAKIVRSHQDIEDMMQEKMNLDEEYRKKIIDNLVDYSY